MHNIFSTFITKNTRFLPSIFLLIILVALIHQLIISDVYQLKRNKLAKYEYYQQKNQQLIQQNTQLMAQLQAISTNVDVTESIARYELDFIKEGEKYYTYPTQ